MNGLVWHDGPLQTLARSADAVAWSVAMDVDPGVLPLRDDLADAAARRDGAARLARRLLARALVARLADCRPDAVAIGRSVHGAPIVTTPAGWHVSVSGNEHRALIGAARQPIGVDREPIVSTDIPWDMMTPGEAAALRSIPASARAQDWLRRWTMKEAHAKLVGEPRRIAPEHIETRDDPDLGDTAHFEGTSAIRGRVAHGGAETVAMWRDGLASRAKQPIRAA